MDSSSTPILLFLFLLSTPLILSKTGESISLSLSLSPVRRNEHTLHSIRKIQHDFVNFPSTTTPTPTLTPTSPVVTVPATTPVTIPPATPTTPVPIPPATPTTPVPIPPATPTTPVTIPPATPTTPVPIPPATPTTPITIPPATPTTPVTIPPATPTTPVTIPPATPVNIPPTTPATSGQRWCVAKSGTPEKTIQVALDYACGIGGADCSAIQQSGSCYNPNTLQNHASFAFNSYYQHNPLPTSCDFGGAATITTTNPSSGSCMFTTSSSSSTPPTMASPVTTTPTPVNPSPTPPTMAPPITTAPTPTTASNFGAAPTGLGTPPTLYNASNPTFGGTTTGFGDGAPVANMTSSVSLSSSIQPFIGSIIVVTSLVTRLIVMDMYH